MCIRDRRHSARRRHAGPPDHLHGHHAHAAEGKTRAAADDRAPRQEARDGQSACLLYTSDAADERSSVDLGGRRILKKKTNKKKNNIQKI